MNLNALRLGNYFIYIFLIILLITAAVMQSRAFFMGYFLAFCTIYVVKSNYKSKLWATLMVIGLSAVLSIFLAFYLKRDSSRGRVLIYKLSARILRDNFPSGIGKNQFGLEYGKYQIKYFASNEYTQKEFLLADNVKYVYNDYMQYIIEFGLLGLSVMVFCLVLTLFLIINALKANPSYPTILLFSCAQVIAFGSAALFTFVLYVPIFQCIIILAIGVILYYNRISVANYLQPIFAVGIIYILATGYGHHLFYRESYKQATEALTLYKAGYFDEANVIYKGLYPNLKFNSGIVRDYVKSLMASREFSKAEELLLTLMLKDDNYVNYNLLAECYHKNNKPALAEVTYINAINKVPNRFTTRFNLFLFYLENGNKRKAFLIGNKILTIPVKVPSNIIDQMKATVRMQLIKLNVKG